MKKISALGIVFCSLLYAGGDDWMLVGRNGETTSRPVTPILSEKEPFQPLIEKRTSSPKGERLLDITNLPELERGSRPDIDGDLQEFYRVCIDNLHICHDSVSQFFSNCAQGLSLPQILFLAQQGLFYAHSTAKVLCGACGLSDD